MTTREDMLLDKIAQLLALVETLRAENARIGEDYITLVELVANHQCTPQPQEANA